MGSHYAPKKPTGRYVSVRESAMRENPDLQHGFCTGLMLKGREIVIGENPKG